MISRLRTLPLLLSASFAYAVLPFAAHADTADLTSLDSGALSRAYQTTDDGTMTVGGDNSRRAILWTNGTPTILGDLGGHDSIAIDISSNGGVVVGISNLANHLPHAFRWTAGGGMVDLGVISGNAAQLYSEAEAVSSDGSVVVGASQTTGGSVHAFRWTQGGGMADLGTLGGNQSWAYDVSGDGNIVVGYSYNASSVEQAIRWTSGTGMVNLGNLGSVSGSGEAHAISQDGTTIVGESLNASNDEHAFRWTQAGGIVDLGVLDGSGSSANGVSADGRIIVGTVDATTGHTFRWTQAGGMQTINTLLTNANVDMTGISVTDVSGISPNGKYISAEASINGTNNAVVILYDDGGGGGGGGGGGTGGITTAAAQQQSTNSLAASQRSTLIQNHSTASMLLGNIKAPTSNTYTYAGAMFGSAVGYTGGQWSADSLTLMGGLAYGAQDYPGITQSNAATIAAGARYKFDDCSCDHKRDLYPYIEAGGWVTPNQGMSLSRNYMNGAGTATGTGSTDAIEWGEYGRGGMMYDMDEKNSFLGYGELGQQAMSFGGYAENMDAGNPFPASVEQGVIRFDVARVGGQWTRKLNEELNLPVSVTLSGDVARSFDVHSGVHATVAGVGTFNSTSEADTWGEFGVTVETQLNEHTAFDVEMNGTSGGGALGTTVHGGAGLNYKF